VGGGSSVLGEFEDCLEVDIERRIGKDDFENASVGGLVGMVVFAFVSVLVYQSAM
jgi:hypothetical protein